MNTVEIPFPPRELSPNGRCHWRVKARVGKDYKKDVFWLCRSANLAVESCEKVDVWLDFYPPDKRHYDADNLVSRLKSGLDGIAEALKINDRKFILHPVLHDETGNKVVVKITEHVDNSTEKVAI
jgi:crossover junction endodeoxyribonuclease RusA